MWYGATAMARTTSSRPPRMTPTTTRGERPDMNAMANTVTTMMMVDPRSGWSTMSARGAPTNSPISLRNRSAVSERHS